MKKPEFRKLHGKWLVFGPASMLRLGADVDVELRDGTTERATVKAIVQTSGEMAWVAVTRSWS